MILTITNLKGGVGKTTTAYYFQHILRGPRLVVDLTTENNLTGLNRATGPDIFQLLTGTGAPTEKGDIAIIPGSSRIGDLEKSLGQTNKPELILRKLDPVFRKYDNTVIDCPAHLGILFRAALLVSDIVIIPTTLRNQSIRDAAGVGQVIDDLKQSKRYGKDIRIKKVFILPTMKTLSSLDRQGMAAIRAEFQDILPEIRHDKNIIRTTETGQVHSGKGLRDYKKVIGRIYGEDYHDEH